MQKMSAENSELRARLEAIEARLDMRGFLASVQITTTNNAMTSRNVAHSEKAVKNRGFTSILTMALAAAAVNTSAETRTNEHPELEKPGVEGALAGQLESQLQRLLM